MYILDYTQLNSCKLDINAKIYDVENVIDLERYLLPTPPVPRRWKLP
jgi:hypothetical protein